MIMPPALDLWTAAAEQDYETRHRRGGVRLPHDTIGASAGELVAAYVCCDPSCGGVELSADVLDLNHGCCPVPRVRGLQPNRPRGQHRAGYGHVWFTGRYHGPFTEHWTESYAW